MVGKVQQREQNLKRQVEQLQLRIEIDDAKRQRDVKKIVETDMFADLQAKAEAIRNRRRQQLESSKTADKESTETKSDSPPAETQPGLTR